MAVQLPARRRRSTRRPAQHLARYLLGYGIFRFGNRVGAGVRLVGYLRVSSEAQLDGLGLKVQEQAVCRWPRQHGHRVVEVCADPAQSGTIPFTDRPGITCALDALKHGRADGLLVLNLGRISRLLTDQEAALAVVWRHGGRVFTAESGEVLADDPDDPMRTAIRQMAGVFFQLDRAMTVKRLRDGRRLKAERGGYAHGRPPFGWRAAGRELVEDPAEQTTLARIRELHGQGKSLRAIAATLEAEGHQPRRGQRWHPIVLARILERL
jgi:DNA invertase Pin-like site-specific DNA recombinase